MKKLTLVAFIVIILALVSYIVFFVLGSMGSSGMEFGVVMISIPILAIGVILLLISGVIYLFKTKK